MKFIPPYAGGVRGRAEPSSREDYPAFTRKKLEGAGGRVTITRLFEQIQVTTRHMRIGGEENTELDKTTIPTCRAVILYLIATCAAPGLKYAA